MNDINQVVELTKIQNAQLTVLRHIASSPFEALNTVYHDYDNTFSRLRDWLDSDGNNVKESIKQIQFFHIFIHSQDVKIIPCDVTALEVLNHQIVKRLDSNVYQLVREAEHPHSFNYTGYKWLFTQAEIAKMKKLPDFSNINLDKSVLYREQINPLSYEAHGVTIVFHDDGTCSVAPDDKNK